MADNIDMGSLFKGGSAPSGPTPTHGSASRPQPAPSAPADAKAAPAARPAASASQARKAARAVSSTTKLVEDAERLLVQRKQRLAAERRAGLAEVFERRSEALPTTAAIKKQRERIEKLRRDLDEAQHKLVADEVAAAVKVLRKEHGDAAGMDAEALIEHFGGAAASA
ncbi:MAG: hypothetical protein ACK5LO_17265 [Leucobacter sp.]